ncbi:MAG: hypothetical protein JW751_01845 [Polyangiaceae bacterium]|nr:hypothetical protein [Polyangiaceae bacterium]
MMQQKWLTVLMVAGLVGVMVQGCKKDKDGDDDGEGGAGGAVTTTGGRTGGTTSTGGRTGGTGGRTGGTGGRTGGTGTGGAVGGAETGGDAGATATGGRTGGTGGVTTTGGAAPTGGTAGEPAVGGAGGEPPTGGTAGAPVAGQPSTGGEGGVPATGGTAGAGGEGGNPAVEAACFNALVAPFTADNEFGAVWYQYSTPVDLSDATITFRVRVEPSDSTAQIQLYATNPEALSYANLFGGNVDVDGFGSWADLTLPIGDNDCTLGGGGAGGGGGAAPVCPNGFDNTQVEWIGLQVVPGATPVSTTVYIDSVTFSDGTESLELNDATATFSVNANLGANPVAGAEVTTGCEDDAPPAGGGAGGEGGSS